MIRRSLLVWLLMMAIETAHGALRNRFLVPVIGDVGSRQIGVLIGSALILGVAMLTIGWIHPTSERSLLVIGAMWAGLDSGLRIRLRPSTRSPLGRYARRLRPQPQRIVVDRHGSPGTLTLDRRAHPSIFVDRTPMAN